MSGPLINVQINNFVDDVRKVGTLLSELTIVASKQSRQMGQSEKLYKKM